MSGKIKFHISCCGRSGSNYVHQCLQAMGLSALHEMNDTWPFPGNKGITYVAKNPAMFNAYDGIIGWKWAALTPVYSGRFPKQFHLVRNPIKAIESATTHSDGLFTQIEKIIGSPKFLTGKEDESTIRLGRAVNYWIKYNQRFGANKIILNVEKFTNGGESLLLFCEEVGIKHDCGQLIDYIPKNVNERKKAKRRVGVTSQLIKELFPKEAEEIDSLSEKYGYKL
jgi:hypothetical protein